MKITYEGGKKFKMEHDGNTILSDQPFEDGGTNEGMTPVALMSGALGACIGLYATEYLSRNNLSPEGLWVDVDWKIADKPKRVGAYHVSVSIPHKLTERQEASLSRIVKACTVHNTMTHPPELDVKLVCA